LLDRQVDRLDLGFLQAGKWPAINQQDADLDGILGERGGWRRRCRRDGEGSREQRGEAQTRKCFPHISSPYAWFSIF